MRSNNTPAPAGQTEKLKMELDSNQNRMKALRPVIMVLFAFLLVMNIANLLFVLIYSSSNFFAASLFSKISIYSSRGIFIVHSILSIVTCSLVLFLVIRKTENRLLSILLFFYLIIFLYPLLAN